MKFKVLAFDWTIMNHELSIRYRDRSATIIIILFLMSKQYLSYFLKQSLYGTWWCCSDGIGHPAKDCIVYVKKGSTLIFNCVSIEYFVREGRSSM